MAQDDKPGALLQAAARAGSNDETLPVVGDPALGDTLTPARPDMANAPTVESGNSWEVEADTGFAHFVPGTVLGGRYKVFGKLGSGGMGAVYSAHDQLIDQGVALKFIRPQLAVDPKERARLRHEVRFAQRVTHVNVARTYTLEEIEGHLFIVMELLAGPTLQARLKEGPVPPAEALRIARDLLLGLAAAHARDVVHRDIKPANIKICEDGRVVVMDFGLARVHDTPGTGPLRFDNLRDHTHTAIGGTPGYIAPEVVRGERGDARADLYSFGVVLFELMAGRAPFQAPTPLELITQHLKEDAPDLSLLRPDVPEHVASVVRRLLAKDPAQRFDSADQTRRALEPEVSAPLPLPARRVGLWVALGSMAAVALGGAAWLAANQTRPVVAPVVVAPPPAPVPAPSGGLVVASEPSDAQVVLDGRLLEARTPMHSDGLAFGDHTLEVRKAGFQPQQVSFSLSSAEPRRVVTARLDALEPERPVKAPPARKAATPVRKAAPVAAEKKPASNLSEKQRRKLELEE